MDDGVYFGIPEDEYHAIERLSASGIKDMLASPSQFWARSWMNPYRNDDDTPARTIGRAWHCARLEPARYEQTYYRSLQLEDHLDALTTDAEVCEALKDMGQPQRLKGEIAADRARRLVDNGFTGEIWSMVREQHAEDHDGMIELPAAVYDEIDRNASWIRQSPEVAEYLTGEPEVTLLWTDAETGVRMKARLDLLRSDGFVDLKTFSNQNGKEIRRAISDAYRFNRYYIQTAVYHSAVEAIRSGEITDAAGSRVVADLRSRKEPTKAAYVFCEKGTPLTVVRDIVLYRKHLSMDAAGGGDVAARYAGPSGLLTKGLVEMRWACNTFKTLMEVYGPDDAWLPTNPIGSLGDDDYPSNWINGDW